MSDEEIPFICPIGRRRCHEYCDQWNDLILDSAGNITGHIEVASCFIKDEARWKLAMGIVDPIATEE